MKRHSLVSVALALVLAALACGSEQAGNTPVIKTATSPAVAEPSIQAAQENTSQAPQATNTAEPSPTPEPAETFLGDYVSSGDVFAAVVQVEDPAPPGRLYDAETGKRLVAVEMIIGNNGLDEVSINPLSVTLIDADGFTYRAELGGRDGQIATADLEQGEQIRGWIAYKVPDSAQLASVDYQPSYFGGPTLNLSLQSAPDGHEAVTAALERDVSQLAKLGDVVETDGYSFSAATLEDPSQPSGFFDVSPGTRLVAVEVVIGNVSAAAFSPNPLEVYLIDSEGFVYRCELGARDGQMDMIDLGPGQRVKGWVAFQIPDTATPQVVKFKPVLEDVSLKSLVAN